jgi:hypothetical protein
VYEVFKKYNPDRCDLLLYQVLRKYPSKARPIYLKSPEFGDAELLALRLIGMDALGNLPKNILIGRPSE